MKVQQILGVVAALVALWSGPTANAQLYHWEWSPRLPRTMPRTFVGAEASVGYTLHRATLPYVEDLITCCTFSDGTGLSYRFAVLAERWVAPTLAVVGGLGFVQSDGLFTATAPGFPTVEHGIVTTTYDLSTTTRYLHLQAGARQRLFGSMASVGVDLRAMVRVSAEYTLLETVQSPQTYRFADGSQSMPLDQQILSSTSAVLLEPAVSVQYDLPLQLGFVVSPMASIQMPLWSVSTEHPWSYMQTSIGLRIVRGL